MSNTSYTTHEKSAREIHVLPVADLMVHEETEDCICGPLVQVGPEGVVVGHRSLDGREVLDKH